MLNDTVAQFWGGNKEAYRLRLAGANHRQPVWQIPANTTSVLIKLRWRLCCIIGPIH